MATPLIRVMNGHIYRVPDRRKRKPELKPSEIPTLLGYTASLVDKKWLRLAARRNHGGLEKSSEWSGMELRVPAAARQAGGVMATPLIRVMNGHIYKVPNRRKRKPELKPSEIPTLLGYTASLVDKKWLRLAARRNHG